MAFGGVGSGDGSVDLATVRMTLSYMQSDLSRRRGMEQIAVAIAAAIREIDRSTSSAGDGPTSDRVPVGTRFVPWLAKS